MSVIYKHITFVIYITRFSLISNQGMNRKKQSSKYYVENIMWKLLVVVK